MLVVSYFKVVRSDLVGLMVDGGTSEIVRGTESGNLKLTPLAYSYDPDVVDRSPLNSVSCVLRLSACAFICMCVWLQMFA